MAGNGSTVSEVALTEALATRAESGRTLGEMVADGPVMLVLLRHFGCTFARQAIEDLSLALPEIQAQGVSVAFAHLGTPELAKPYFDYYRLSDIERFADPEARLYGNAAFGIQRGSVWQTLGPANWWGWLAKSGVRRHGISKLQADPKIMPGVFVFRDGQIATRYVHRKISDRPDYLKLAR